MLVVSRLDELRDRRAAMRGTVGLVPTMGALHDGHASLVEQARRDCAHVIVSIFEPATLGRYFEGERRPGHFRGVATIVLKLLNAVQPEHAYFGQKDAQQLAIIQRMVFDLNIPTAIHACATVREADGLALSSRNAYLGDAERQAAPNLVAALREVVTRLAAGESDITAVLATARQRLAPLREDYLGVVDPAEFEPLHTAPPGTTLAVIGAAFAGATRLIDNLTVQTPAEREMVKR